MGWMREHLERQERLYRGLEMNLLSEELAELLDQEDNKIQEKLVKKGEKRVDVFSNICYN